MKNLKSILLMVLYGILFIILESISTMVALIYKINIDEEYANSLLNAIENLDYSNIETVNTYMTLCYEIIPMVLILTTLLSLVPIGIYIYKKKIKLMKKIPIIDGIQLCSFAIVINIVISAIVSALPENLLSSHSEATGYLNSLPFIPMLLSIGILAPLIEELFFRFLMVNKLKSKPILAIILPALTFGIVHGNIVQGTYAFILGMLFSYIYLKTDNLLNTFILHVSINSSSVIISFIPVEASIVLVGISFILTIILFIKNKNFLQTKKDMINENTI